MKQNNLTPHLHVYENGSATTSSLHKRSKNRVLVRYLAQKLIMIHDLEKKSEFPRWKTNIDWVRQLRRFHGIETWMFPDTTIINWKQGGTSHECWNKEIPNIKNSWFCQFLGFSSEMSPWRNGSLDEFSEFYRELQRCSEI